MTISEYYHRIRNYCNANVWLTNILLIPSIILSFINFISINKWKFEDKIKNYYKYIYKFCWLLLSIMLLIIFIFSVLNHRYMFTKTKYKLQKIGKIDLITAPLGLILLLFMIYYYHHISEKENSCILNNSLNIYDIYLVGVLFIFIGIIIFIIKELFITHKYHIKQQLIYNIKYTTGHTIFHYILYTGILMMVIIYSINLKPIFLSYLNKKCDKFQKENYHSLK